jgi:predicted ABC-type ATPase
MRVFAGPNGSGKSTVINKVRTQQSEGRPIDFGFYVNADDIAQTLIKGSLDFSPFEIETSQKEFKQIAMSSGLINNGFPENDFETSFYIRKNKLHLKNKARFEYIAQITADFLRKRLLALGKKFSFETVFSHESKLDIMKQAVEAGYKVYLYFVSTSSPQINMFRVEARVAKGGHYVDPDKIISRYQRSMDLLFDAAQLAYQAFFFDNSKDGEDSSVLFAHFKKPLLEKKWDPIDENIVPTWFVNHYSKKVSKK